MKKLKLDSGKFEILSEDAEGKLISGFSEAFEGEAVDQMGTDANSCHNVNCGAGTNCIAGCGSK
jgi:hypothetical protein